jgi:hypothetical protein
MKFELIPYDQIMDVANGSREVRAFIFKRNNDLYVVYWHISDSKKIELALNPDKITLLESLWQEMPIPSSGQNINSVVLPVGKRRYIKTGSLTQDQIAIAFKNAKIW